jgi:hypothetical protein
MNYIQTNISTILWEALKDGDLNPSDDCVLNRQHYHALLFVGATKGQIYASIFPKAFNLEMVALVEKSLGFLNTIRNTSGADFGAQMGFPLAEKAMMKIINMFPTIEIGAVNSPFEANELPMLYSF